MDCGPTCLRMIAKHYGKHYNTETIRYKAGFSKRGVSMLGISETAEKLGFRTRGVQVSYEKLCQAPVPAILHWNQKHFVVLINVNKKQARIADPSAGIITYKKEKFTEHWLSNKRDDENTGTVLLLEPTPAFYSAVEEKEKKLNWAIVGRYMQNNRWPLMQVFIALITSSILQLILPFLTQSMVDAGINTGNMQYITLVLIAQLMLVFSNTVVSFIRSRIQLRISNNINISILSDFWMKLSRLPLSYFEARRTGDTLQRLGDNKKIQSFITGHALTTVFNLFNILVYGFILILYNLQLFIIFGAGTILYFGWIRFFLRIRRQMNQESFNVSARANNATLELVQGMQEIRLNNAEHLKRWEWENIQANIFRINFRNMNYSQWQSAGALFIHQGKDIIISFMVAQLVVNGSLTFGAMLAIQYIIGQLTGPVQQIIDLAQNIQDAKIAMERLNEIHTLQDEEPSDKPLMSVLPSDNSISVRNLSFAYPGEGNDPVLEDISLYIPQGKVTAIVGVSGSGKTTLLKLLLKIYGNYSGEINIGDSNFRYLSHSFWRKQCGAVLQDGYIFNDTLARNIAVGEEYIDYERLIYSCKVANILPFIESLPNGFNSQLGTEGTGISQGQRQRLLIARAVYKDPAYLFFDEATNSLDANNERTIVKNLQLLFKDKTVVIVAHRLSTVKGADKIVVLHKGRIEEEGTHAQLTSMRGHYYELVKNQLEIDV